LIPTNPIFGNPVLENDLNVKTYYVLFCLEYGGLVNEKFV